MNSVGIFIVNAKLARKLKDRQLHFREEKVQLNFKFIVFFYGLANVLLVNSVSKINTAPGEARVEEKLFFFVTCLLPKFGVCRNFVISLQLSSRRS